MMELTQRLKIGMMTLFVVLLMTSGCGTTTPDLANPKSYSYDSTTPKQYDPYNSGFLTYLTRTDSKGKVYTYGGVITQGALVKYNKLISVYKIKFDQTYKVSLEKNDGTSLYTDTYGNSLVCIDSEHLSYFSTLKSFAINHVPEDSLIDRAASLVK